MEQYQYLKQPQRRNGVKIHGIVQKTCISENHAKKSPGITTNCSHQKTSAFSELIYRHFVLSKTCDSHTQIISHMQKLN